MAMASSPEVLAFVRTRDVDRNCGSGFAKLRRLAPCLRVFTHILYSFSSLCFAACRVVSGAHNGQSWKLYLTFCYTSRAKPKAKCIVTFDTFTSLFDMLHKVPIGCYYCAFMLPVLLEMGLIDVSGVDVPRDRRCTVNLNEPTMVRIWLNENSGH